jgi:hypothetical protein
MSNDHGDNGMCPDYHIKARLRAAIDAEGVPWGDLVKQSGYSESSILQAIESGTHGLPSTIPILDAIARILGRDINWLLAGNSDCVTRFKASLTERVMQLVWEYIYKNNVPKHEWDLLCKTIKRGVVELRSNTVQAAHRAGIPRTWKDVASIHSLIRSRTKANG